MSRQISCPAASLRPRPPAARQPAPRRLPSLQCGSLAQNMVCDSLTLRFETEAASSLSVGADSEVGDETHASHLSLTWCGNHPACMMITRSLSQDAGNVPIQPIAQTTRLLPICMNSLRHLTASPARNGVRHSARKKAAVDGQGMSGDHRSRRAC